MATDKAYGREPPVTTTRNSWVNNSHNTFKRPQAFMHPEPTALSARKIPAPKRTGATYAYR